MTIPKRTSNKFRHFLSRTHWALRLLKLKKYIPSDKPGLIMVQIDGLSKAQFNRGLKQGHLPFLKHLIYKDQYVPHSLYSGLPSNTPAVQGELMYGVKGCVPAFSYMDRKSGKNFKMLDTAAVEQVEDGLKTAGEGLLKGGSVYSDIFTGGAQEAHLCWGRMGWDGFLRATKPWVLPFLFLLYIDIFIRVFLLLILELILALVGAVKGMMSGWAFFRELEFVFYRVVICVALREFVVAGVCMDIARGVPVIHMNFLGYDEQAHCRGPSSRYAHWSLRGIDDAIRRIGRKAGKSELKSYELWVYSDHGQDKTVPYQVRYGKTPGEAIQKLFTDNKDSATVVLRTPRVKVSDRQELWKAKIRGQSVPGSGRDKNKILPDVVFTAMGPWGQVYLKKKLTPEEQDYFGNKLVEETKVPLVLVPRGKSGAIAWTARGKFILPEQAAEVLGEDHPFLAEAAGDLIGICHHPDAGEFILGGWAKGAEAISFSMEFGAHAGLSEEETHAFALLPVDTPLELRSRSYLRPLDLREAALHILNKETSIHFFRSRLLAPKPVPPVPKIHLMTYNVHSCLGSDGKFSVDRIARVIARHDPDIIALQELDVGRVRSGKVDQAEKIARRMEMAYHFHPAFRFEDGHYGNAILSRYPMGLIKMASLPRSAERKGYEPRGALWVNLDVNGIKVQLINTHLSYWPHECLLQAKHLLGPEWLQHPDCRGPVILCGDFNSAPGFPVYRRLNRHLKDSQKILKKHRPSGTWQGKYLFRRIDHVFLSVHFEVAGIRIPHTALERVASDHLPLVVELKL